MKSKINNPSKGDKSRSGIDSPPAGSAPAGGYEFEIASRDQLQEIVQQAGRAMTHQQIAGALRIYDENDKYVAVGRRLKAMARDGQLLSDRRGAFLAIDTDLLVIGKVTAHPDGYGFLVPDGNKTPAKGNPDNAAGGDIYLDERQMRRVLDGDTVQAQITGSDRRGRRHGAVVTVLERANTRVVGRLQQQQGKLVFQPDNRRLPRAMAVLGPRTGSAGQMVVADLQQPTLRESARATVVEVLGEHLAAGMEIDVAIQSHGLPAQWPAGVVNECEGIADHVDSAEIAARKDLRKTPFVTIDGEDARDFDDAVYAEHSSNGWRLQVAIADVSHYVRPGTELDSEALNRGTSVYFPQRVLPMLPEKLSNGLCSLNPQVDRLAMVCELFIDRSGKIRRSRFFSATICSAARLTYNDVGAYLSGEKGRLPDALHSHIDKLHGLFSVLLKARLQRGVIEFDSGEAVMTLDGNGKIERIEPVQRNDAHRLIEECMIAANIAAARFLERHQQPGPFRIHEPPAGDKLAELRQFLALRGLSLAGGDTPEPTDFAETLHQAQGRTDYAVLQTVMLRSLTQALYSVGNRGHFGLALSHYAHFTSPIRRYPDLLVHRAIRDTLAKRAEKADSAARQLAEQTAAQCSHTERRAEQAQRDVHAWLKCEYMQQRIGQSFSGVISAVTSFGLFVLLDDVPVEGLVHVSNLPADFYQYDNTRMLLEGRRSGKRYELGQSVFVSVAAVNLDDRKIDLELITGAAGDPSKKPRRKKKRQRR